MKKIDELVDLNNQIKEKYNEIDKLRLEIQRVEKENIKEIVKERKQTLVGKTFRRNVYDGMNDTFKVKGIAKNGDLIVDRVIYETYPKNCIDLHIYTNQVIAYDTDCTEVDHKHCVKTMSDAQTIVNKIYDELC